MRVGALAVFLIVCSSSEVRARQQEAQSTIAGTVVSSVDGTPIVGARVSVFAGNGNPRPSTVDQLLARLTSANPASLTPGPLTAGAFAQGRPSPSVITGTDGTFSLTIAAGVYRVLADANNYVPAELGQRGTVGLGTPIYLGPGQALTTLTIRMSPTGVVTGRIADATGMPASEVPVQVLRVNYTKLGQRLMETGGIAVTDDRGEYRLFGISPGRYYLNAGSMVLSNAASLAVGRVLFEGVDPQSIPRPQSLKQIYTMTYFPGTPDLDRALAIEVKAGQESRVNLSVSRAARYSVSGRVVDSQTGRPPQNTSISLTYQNQSGGTESRSTSLNPDTGAFNFESVIPGTYLIRAQGRVTPPAGQRGAGLAAQIAAQQAAELAAPAASVRLKVDGNVENVALTMASSTPLEGLLTVDGQTPSGFPLDGLRPGLRQPGGANPIGPSVSISPDGTFRFNGLPEEDYKFAITGLPPGFYVEKAEINGTDLLNDAIHFSSSVFGKMNVNLQQGTGTIVGTVTDSAQLAVSGVEVVLVPDQRQRIDLYKSAISDREGRYTLTDIPPGDYRLFSWEAIAANAYYDPEILGRYEAMGKSLRVTRSSNTAAEIKIIPAEP